MTASPSESLIEFWRLAKAGEEQSLIEDLSILLVNLPVLALPLAFLAVTSVQHYRKQINYTRGSKDDNGNIQSAYPSTLTVLATVAALGVCHAMNFDLGLPFPLSQNANVTAPSGFTSTNISSTSTTTKPYSDYSSFYHEAYVDFHVNTASRISHCILATSVITIWIWDSRLAVASIAALLTGALSTSFLVAAWIQQPFVEMSLMLLTGMAISRRYGTLAVIRWFVLFVIWLLMDYMDHFLFGQNSSVAMFVGQHYLSWALVGQLQLAITTASSFLTAT